MKQHFRSSATGDGFLSMEEEAILLAEVTECDVAADAAIASADRIAEVQRGMDDVGIIMATMPDTTSVEDQLAQSVAEMAVAGTDTDPVALLSDVSDQLDGTVIATEDNALTTTDHQAEASGAGQNNSNMVQKALEQLAKIWEAIKAAIAEAWKAIRHQMSHMFGVIENAQNAVKILLAKYNEIGNVEPKDKSQLTVYNMGDAFRCEGKMLLGDDRVQAINKLNVFMKSLYGVAPKKVLAIGKHIENTFRNFNPAQPEASIKKFADELSPLFDEYTRSFTSTGNYISDPHDSSGTTTIASGPLLGNFQATVSIPAALANKDTENPIEALVLASKIRAGILKADTPIADSNAGLVFHVQNSSFYASALVGIAGLLHVIMDYKSGNIATQLAGQAAAIERATSDALNKAKRSGNVEAMAALKKIVSINNAYSNWANQPMLKALSSIGSVIRGEIQMCRTALHRFK